LNIPYTHSGVISSFNAMNKIISKEIFIKNNIKTPKFFALKKNEFKIEKFKKKIIQKKINFPIVVKPINEGSSLGVKVCKDKKKLINDAKNLFKKVRSANI
jgi:D-alanine-D-alanine ligase